MNPDFRKVALIAAGLGLIVSLFFALSPGDDEVTTQTTTTVITTAAPEPPATTAPKPPEIVRIRIAVPSDTAPTLRRFSVKQGRKVEIVVESEIADEMHVHGYDLMAKVAPGQPAIIAFEATAPGRFEIELEDHHLPIAELEVRP